MAEQSRESAPQRPHSTGGDPSPTVQNKPSPQAPGQRSQPPQRGLLKRVHQQQNAQQGPAAAKRTRRPVTREELTGTSRSPTQRSSARPAASRTGRPTAAGGGGRENSGFTDPGAERMRLEQELEKKRKAEEERKKQAEAEKNKLTAEQEAAKKAEEERKRKEAEQARQRAEEEKRRQKEEAERRKAEAERIRKEKEVEAKRLEEERIQREKEAEQQRIEAEKARQEQERQRIVKKISACMGDLKEEEEQLARKIAEEMVARNIHWHGYISLSGGIGGAMKQ